MTKEDYRMTRSSFGSDKSPKSSPDLDDTACQDGRNAWHPARSSNSTKETTVSRTSWQPKSPSCSHKLSRRGCGTHDSIRTGQLSSGTMFYGLMKVPFSFSVEQSGLL